MANFDDFDIGPQCDERIDDDYPYDDDDAFYFYGYPQSYSMPFGGDDIPF